MTFYANHCYPYMQRPQYNRQSRDIPVSQIPYLPAVSDATHYQGSSHTSPNQNFDYSHCDTRLQNSQTSDPNVGDPSRGRHQNIYSRSTTTRDNHDHQHYTTQYDSKLSTATHQPNKTALTHPPVIPYPDATSPQTPSIHGTRNFNGDYRVDPRQYFGTVAYNNPSSGNQYHGATTVVVAENRSRHIETAQIYLSNHRLERQEPVQSMNSVQSTSKYWSELLSALTLVTGPGTIEHPESSSKHPMSFTALATAKPAGDIPTPYRTSRQEGRIDWENLQHSDFDVHTTGEYHKHCISLDGPSERREIKIVLSDRPPSGSPRQLVRWSKKPLTLDGEIQEWMICSYDCGFSILAAQNGARANLAEHERALHAGKSFSCPVRGCRRIFKTRWAAVMHLRRKYEKLMKNHKTKEVFLRSGSQEDPLAES